MKCNHGWTFLQQGHQPERQLNLKLYRFLARKKNIKLGRNIKDNLTNLIYRPPPFPTLPVEDEGACWTVMAPSQQNLQKEFLASQDAIEVMFVRE